jgi:hypothetical protein
MSNKFKILLVFHCINKNFYMCSIMFDDHHLLNRFTHVLQTAQGFDWYAKLFSSVNDLVLCLCCSRVIR